MNTNQIGRELTRRLVDAVGCDLQTAVRFFYNSELYLALEDLLASGVNIEEMYARFEKEYTGEKQSRQ